MKKLAYKFWYKLKCGLLQDEFMINGWTKEEHIKCQKYLLDTLNPQKHDEILELGCGTGIHLRNFSFLCKKVIGIDHLECMIKKAKNNTLGMSNVKLMHRENIEKLPFPDNSFDKAFSWSIFQYFIDRIEAENMLKEIFRVTKNNGIIFIGDIPSIVNKKYCLKSFLDYFNYFFYLFYDPFVFSEFCERNLGKTKIISQNNLLPNYKARFDILIKVRK